MYVVDYKDNNKNDVDDLVGYKVSHHLCIKGFFYLFSLASDVLTPVLRQLVFFTVNMSSTRLWESMAKMIMITSGQHFLAKGFFSQIKLVCFVFPFRKQNIQAVRKAYLFHPL